MLFRSEMKDREAQEKIKDRLGEVERQLRLLQLEWQETLDMLKRQMHRVIKERQRIEAAAPDDAESQAAEPSVTPGLDPISERILARRNRVSQRGMQQ